MQRAGADEAQLSDEPVVHLSGGDIGFGQQRVEQGDAVLDTAQVEAELGGVAVGAERFRPAAAAKFHVRGARQVPQCLVAAAQVHAGFGKITVEAGGVDRVGRPVGGQSQGLGEVRVRGLRVPEAEMEPAAQSECAGQVPGGALHLQPVEEGVDLGDRGGQVAGNGVGAGPQQ